jgi:hypothetical protein
VTISIVLSVSVVVLIRYVAAGRYSE